MHQAPIILADENPPESVFLQTRHVLFAPPSLSVKYDKDAQVSHALLSDTREEATVEVLTLILGGVGVNFDAESEPLFHWVLREMFRAGYALTHAINDEGMVDLFLAHPKVENLVYIEMDKYIAGAEIPPA